MLDEAVKKVGELKAVSADVTQYVEMLGQKFDLKGQYLKAPGYRVYLKLSVNGLGDTAGTMLQICDGQLLWDYQQVLTNKFYSRLDVSKVLKKLEAPEFGAETRKKVLDQIGFAGPEALLIGLRESLKFDRKEADKLDGKDVWVLRGEWKDLARLRGPNQPQFQPNSPLPAYVPSFATVWLGQDDGWPYKVQLEGRVPSVLEETRQLGPDGKPIGAKGAAPKVQPSKLLLLYTNVKLNPDLKPETFAFQAPPETPVMDLTDQFLLSLEQGAAALQAEQKKAAASKETELPQAIPVPKPDNLVPPPGGAISPPVSGAGKSP